MYWLERKALRSPSDRFHAAMVLHHGAEPRDALMAHMLATAAAFDRYLQASGHPQVFGTQRLGSWRL
ncbi:hypothetical protein [Nonomuraea sp. LPB2021202275-12-8]|uniref:hypothetical protein n=1 Tax=Nonomuraea sp. LPB2021202275-12-8 TaxID=3120159 RepID=UPI00300D5A74